MSVGEDNGIDTFGIKMREAAIHFVSIFPPPLIEAAIEKNFLAINFEKVLGACRCACRTAKFQFHKVRVLKSETKPQSRIWPRKSPVARSLETEQLHDGLKPKKLRPLLSGVFEIELNSRP